MKKILIAAALIASCGAAHAADYKKPYFGVLASTLIPDGERPNIRPWGTQIIGGIPLNKNISIEPNAFVYYMPRKPDDTADLQWGGGVDLNLHQSKTGLSTFVLLGGGAAYEDVTHVEGVAGYANAGVGFINEFKRLPNLSLRGEARVVYGTNTVSTPSGGNTIDSRFSLGFVYGFHSEDDVPPPPPAPIDTDGDGVADPVDQCPGTPPGTAVDATGCPALAADADADGIPDSLDQCPGTPVGTAVDPTGCAIVAKPTGNPDEDGDGVLNEADKCPNTPASFKVDAVGCLVEQTLALQAVNFEFGSDDLTADAKTLLDGIANGLAAQKAVKVLVTGHTDSLGPQSYNLSLSQKRAKAVVAYLTSKGVEADRLKSEGEGEFSPIASNDTDAGRAKNRRVEFKIVTQ